MTFSIGSSVSTSSGQSARILSLTSLFGQDYADVFIEPAGPLQRMLVSDLQMRSDPFADLSQGRGLPAPFFLAHIAAHYLNSLKSQPGVLSAANFRITPLPHQVLAVDFVLGQFKPRALIADEVGLGKTIEAAMIFEELKLRRQARRALIITPAGLTRQWQDELAQKFGEKFVLMDRNMFSALREMHGKETNLWKLHDQVITSLDFLKPRKIYSDLSEPEKKRREEHNRQIFENLVNAGWDVVIMDEAHKLSKDVDGKESARYKVGEALSEAVPVFLLLTATPHQGKPKKFLHLLSLVDPLSFTREEDLNPQNVSKIVWRTRKRAAIDGNRKKLFMQRVTDVYPVDRSSVEYALERELYDKVSEYIRDNYNRAFRKNDRAFGFLMVLFQRMLTSSTQAIHDSMEKRLKMLARIQDEAEEDAQAALFAQDEFDEEEAYDQDADLILDDLLGNVPGVVSRAELAKEIVILSGLVKIARVVLKGTDSKVAALLNIIDEIRRREGPNTKFLIFTEFVATQKMLSATLRELGYKVVVIHGGCDISERTIARHEFSEDAQFMVSTDAGGEGVNLQFAHVMVNYDMPWNPMKLEQRIGRLDRIGQTHNVIVLNLMIMETIENRVREVLESKLTIVRTQYGDDKLADILSTLQEEFQFDKLYMEALAFRQAQAADLEKIGVQIFERARQILDQDDLLLPQAQAELNAYEKFLVEVSPDRLKTLVEGQLSHHGEIMNEYARRSGVYHFNLPENGGKAHYAEVVFERQKALDDDSLTYLHMNHPLVQRLMDEIMARPGQALAQVRVKLNDLPNNGGFWALFILEISQPSGLERSEMVPVFVGADGASQPRLAKAILNLTPAQVDSAYVPMAADALAGLSQLARQEAERTSANLFSEIQITHAEKIERERQKLEQFYRQQESAIRLIGIENIRSAKQREMFEHRRADLDALDRRSQLVPELKMVGMAWVVS